MAATEPRGPVESGETAPDFVLPAVDRDGVVSLADYRGRSPLLLAINRGLWCPFCRRHVARLGVIREKLLADGVETLAIVATQPERARLYYRFRPTSVPLAADPDLETHRSYGLPKPTMTPELIEAAKGISLDPMGDLPAPVPLLQATETVNRLDAFELTETDQNDIQTQYLSSGPQLTGQFLIDRDGIVRWTNIECAAEGLAGAGKFPSDEELLAAARELPG